MLEMFSFMRNAIFAAMLASFIFGIIGTYVVVKRIVFISGGIAHASFGGVGLAFFMGLNPLVGAAIFAVGSAVGVGVMGEKAIKREDTAIGIVWAMGMAIGAFFYHITPGYLPSPSSFLFGNMLMISMTDVYLLLILNISIIALVGLFFHKLQAVSFDDEFTRVVGVPTFALNLLLLIMVALSIVLLIKLVGIILVIAMLAIPASIASGITHDMRNIMIYSVLLSMAFLMSGLWQSMLWDLPPGPTIILIAGAVFMLAMIYDWFRG